MPIITDDLAKAYYFVPAGRPREILARVLRRIRVEGACWIWSGPDSGSAGRGAGYPRMSLDGATVAPHRVMYTLFNGYIPPRKQIDHKCRCRRCVNPDHLEMVTHRENMRRRDVVIKPAKGEARSQPQHPKE